MKTTRGERLFVKFWQQFLERMGAYWTGPGIPMLRDFLSAGMPSMGLDTVISDWMRWTSEPLLADLDEAVSESLNEAPPPGGRGRRPPKPRQAIVRGEYAFEAVWRWAPVEQIAAEVSQITSEQANVIANTLQRGMLGQLTVDETARELRNIVGLHPRQIAAIARAEERLRNRGLDGDKLAKRVDRLRKRALRFRSMNIARSSYARLIQHEQIEAIDASKAYDEGIAVFLIWITTPDERLCPLCSAMNGVEVEYGKDFKLPDGRNVKLPAYSHPQCRCSLVIRHKNRITIMREKLDIAAIEKRYNEYLAQLPPSEAKAVADAVDDAIRTVTEAVGMRESDLIALFRKAATDKVNGSVHWGVPIKTISKLAEALGVSLPKDSVPVLTWSDLGYKIRLALWEWFVKRAPKTPAQIQDNNFIPERIKRLIANSGVAWENVSVRLVTAPRATADIWQLAVNLRQSEMAEGMFHELLHIVETSGNPRLVELSERIRDSLITSNRVRSLKQVASSFEDYEIGYPILYHEYMGKKYDYRATEVLSMCGTFFLDDTMTGILILERQLLAHLIYALKLY
ncbi:MAG: hypothetical protein QXW98_04890 [Candidatus Caldarchaeum sp.]